jgi:plasmid stability protein
MMASLTIRNIPEETKRRFRQRAAAHGRSMEEEARQLILKAAANEAPPRKSMWDILYDASRPGIDLPEASDSPASYATFDE